MGVPVRGKVEWMNGQFTPQPMPVCPDCCRSGGRHSRYCSVVQRLLIQQHVAHRGGPGGGISKEVMDLIDWWLPTTPRVTEEMERGVVVYQEHLE